MNRKLTIYECAACKEMGGSEKEDPEEAGMVCCQNDHVFCAIHINEVDQDILEELVEVDTDRGVIAFSEAQSLYEKIKSGTFVREDKRQKDGLLDKIVKEVIFNHWPEKIPEEVCPICTLKVIQDKTIIDRLLKMAGTERKSIEDLIRVEADTLEELYDSWE